MTSARGIVVRVLEKAALTSTGICVESNHGVAVRVRNLYDRNLGIDYDVSSAVNRKQESIERLRWHVAAWAKRAQVEPCVRAAIIASLQVPRSKRSKHP